MNKKPFVLIGMSLALALGCESVHAADYTWDGATALWNSSNWTIPPSSTLVPGPTGSSNSNSATITSGMVSFAQNDTFGQASTTSTVIVNLNGGTLASNGFFNTIVNLNLGGGTLLANGGVNASFPAFELIGTVTVTGSTASLINVGSGSNNQINLGGSTIPTATFNVADVTGDNATDLTVNTVLQNGQGFASALAKGGAGTMVLNGANTYTGGTILNAGTLTVGSGGTLGGPTGTLSVNNANVGPGSAVVLNLSTGGATTTGSLTGTLATPSSGSNTATINNSAGLTVTQTTDGTFAGSISGTGAFTKAGANSLKFSQGQTFGGNVNQNAGTLDLNGATSSIAGTLTVNGGTLQNGTLNLLGTVGTNNVTGSVASGTATISTNLSSSTVGLTKSGGGTLLLSGTSTFTNSAQGANTSIFAGTLEIGNSGSFTTASRLLASSGGTLQIDTGGQGSFGGDGGANSNFVGVDGGVGTVTVNGGTLNFNSGTNGSGYLRIAANSGSGSLITLSSGTVNVGQSASIGARFDNGAAAATGSGALTISGGTFNVGTGSDTSTVNGVNGALYLKNSTAGTTGTATVNLNGGTLSVKQIVAGTQGTSVINLNGGTLQARSSNTSFLAASTGLSVQVGANTSTIDTQTNSITIGAPLLNNGAGGITKIGSGTLTLTANNTYAGTTTINAGTLLVNNPNTAGTSGTGSGLVSVVNGTLGGTGILTNTSGVNVASGGTINTSYGALTLTAPLTLAGTLQIAASGATSTPLIVNGSVLLSGSPTLAISGTLDGVSTYNVLDYSSFTGGTFANTISGYTINYSGHTFSASDIELVPVAVPEPATWMAGLLSIGALVWSTRRRFSGSLVS